MDNFPKATTRLATCRAILSMLRDETQTPTLRPITREQVAEVWNGCDLCLDDSWQRILMIPKLFDHTNMLSAELAQFCPACGRPLTDKAVDMVMERLEALRDEKG